MKQYSKPQIVFEDFSLSVNIAAGCGQIAYYAEGECGIEDDWGKIIFITEISGCDVKADLNGTDNSYCYQNPSGEMKVYNS